MSPPPIPAPTPSQRLWNGTQAPLWRFRSSPRTPVLLTCPGAILSPTAGGLGLTGGDDASALSSAGASAAPATEHMGHQERECKPESSSDSLGDSNSSGSGSSGNRGSEKDAGDSRSNEASSSGGTRVAPSVGHNPEAPREGFGGGGPRFGLGPIDAVLVVDEDLAGGAKARRELSGALQRLLTVPTLAGAAGGISGRGGRGDGAAASGGVVGGRVVTVVRFVTEGTLEETCLEEEAGVGGLEVSPFGREERGVRGIGGRTHVFCTM